jgi:ATP-binding cassette subfamily B (MDR/TAP) protein 1
VAFSTNSAYAIALFYGVKLVNRDEIADGGTVVTVLFCSVMASSAMSFIAPILPDFIKAAAASQHVVKAIGNPVEGRSATDGDVGEKINNLEGDLEIKDISFCYPERPKIAVIKNLSLRIPKNKVTAIVGPSGSGKSTVIGLLVRLLHLSTERL